MSPKDIKCKLIDIPSSSFSFCLFHELSFSRMHCICDLRPDLRHRCVISVFQSAGELTVSNVHSLRLTDMDTRIASTKLINKLKELQDISARLHDERCAADVQARKAQQVTILL